MMNWLQSIFTSALFKGRKTRVLCVLTLLALVVVLSAAALPNDTLSSPQTNITYYACVNNTSGTVTIVSQSTKCPSGTHKIHWNQQGPIGPQGIQGPQGYRERKALLARKVHRVLPVFHRAISVLLAM